MSGILIYVAPNADASSVQLYFNASKYAEKMKIQPDIIKISEISVKSKNFDLKFFLVNQLPNTTTSSHFSSHLRFPVLHLDMTF